MSPAGVGRGPAGAVARGTRRGLPFFLPNPIPKLLGGKAGIQAKVSCPNTEDICAEDSGCEGRLVVHKGMLEEGN